MTFDRNQQELRPSSDWLIEPLIKDRPELCCKASNMFTESQNFKFLALIFILHLRTAETFHSPIRRPRGSAGQMGLQLPKKNPTSFSHLFSLCFIQIICFHWFRSLCFQLHASFVMHLFCEALKLSVKGGVKINRRCLVTLTCSESSQQRAAEPASLLRTSRSLQQISTHFFFFFFFEEPCWV